MQISIIKKAENNYFEGVLQGDSVGIFHRQKDGGEGGIRTRGTV